MGFRNGAYASLWNVIIPSNSKDYCYGKMTIGKKSGNGEYVNTFNGMVFFSKEANEKARSLGLPQKVDSDNPVYKKIHIINSDATNKFDAENYHNAMNVANGNQILEAFIKSHANIATYTIYDFELADDANSGGVAKQPSSKTSAKNDNKSTVNTSSVVEEEELPF